MEKRDLVMVLDNLFDAVYTVDGDRHIVYWSPGAEKLTGFTSAEMVGTDCRESMLVHVSKEGGQFCDEHCPLLETDSLAEVRESEVFLRHKAGHMVPVQTRMLPFRDEAGAIVGAAEIFSDVSVGEEIRKRLAELERLARLDPLTRLPNRRHLEEQISAHLAELDRFGRAFGIILMDIDGFDELTSKHSVSVGDDVLKMVARTLILSSRPFDVVGRWEDQTFMGLVMQLDGRGLRAAASRFHMLIGKSELPWGAEPIRVTASVGATLTRRGDKSENLITRAERMLKEAERQGGDRLVLE
jgi:diguanylate cyclase (GGDEF)-like protein/PAS domain S-box-containing protein